MYEKKKILYYRNESYRKFLRSRKKSTQFSLYVVSYQILTHAHNKNN